jgi:spermidine synthase
VTGVEINPIIVDDLMMNRYLAFTGGLFTSPRVRIVTADARSLLERTHEQYDVIQENAVDTWAAVSGGGFTLSESYLYTVEAFEQYLRRLRPGGQDIAAHFATAGNRSR